MRIGSLTVGWVPMDSALRRELDVPPGHKARAWVIEWRGRGLVLLIDTRPGA